jgi:DNA-binding transcriptional LysR family regulator
MREMVMDVCNEKGVKLYARFRSEREDWVQAMVLANIGFAIIPEYSVTHLDSIRRPLIDPTVERTISLVTLPGRKHSRAVTAFIRSIRTYKWGQHEAQGSNASTAASTSAFDSGERLRPKR